MDHEAVLAVLPTGREKALSMKEIAQTMGLEISTHNDWIRAERRLARSLRVLVKWGWVACDKRQKSEGPRFWFKAYWKTDMVRHEDSE